MYFAPQGEGEKRRGPMPLGLFLFSSFFVVTCPRLLAFARPDKYLPCLSLHGLGLVSSVTLISFTLEGEGEQRRGLMPLGLFLFFGGHLPQTSGFRSAKQIFVANFRFTSYARILSDCNTFGTLWGGRITAASNAPGAFLVHK